tara:strand:- start:57 stop:1103 length:1047 start_codon:yes stop_codon:yes gene_type:complete
MNDLITNFLKNRKISGDNLSHKVILNLVSLSKKFQLIGFISSVYKFSDKPKYEELNSIRKLFIAKKIMMIHDLKLICSTFKKKHINYCILKGPALDISGVYDASTRFFRDLDILVAKEDLELAFKTLNDLGYKYMNKFARNSCNFLGNHHHLPLMLNQNNTFVELHHRATAPRHYKECPITENILKEKVSCNEIFIPSPEALIGHTIYHGVIQHEYSIGPVILFDIKGIMRKYDLEHQKYNSYASLLELDLEFKKINELLVDIDNKDEIENFNERLNNIRRNIILEEKEGEKIHISDYKKIIKKLANNFFHKKIESTEFNYQTSRSSPMFPIWYLKELLKSIKNIRVI